MSRIKAAPPASASGPLAHLFPAPAPAQDHSGQFQLVCEIASGGMATVHLGINRGLAGFEKFAAVKRIHRHLAQDKEFYEMFIDEARIAAQVNHPFVCSVFDFGQADQTYYIAMEFLNGEPLSRVLACAGTQYLSEARFPKLVARIVANLAEGLHAAHSLCDASGSSLDIIHRDVTPQNLFVLYDGTVRVTDFGIARAKNRLHHTHGQRLKGTLGYMAPEQLQRGDLDAGVDIWSLGVVMWEMLTARPLFQSTNDGEAVMEILTQPIVPPSTFNPRVSTALDRIVMRCLERKRSNRYATARELSRALEQYLTSSGATVHATDVAEWLGQLFPTGKERGRELLDMARAAAGIQAQPEPSHDDTAPSTRREPLASRRNATPPPPPRDSMASLPALAVDEPTAVSPTAPISVPRTVSQPRRVVEQIVGVAILGTAALIGFAAPKSLIQESTSTASQRAPHTATLNSLLPSASSPVKATAQSQSQSPRWSPPLLLDSTEASLPKPQPQPQPQPAKQALARTQSSPALPNAPAMPDFLPARDFLPRSQVGALFVSTPGISASVFESGRLLGRTSQQIDMVAGRHSLQLKSGTESHSVEVDVSAGVLTIAKISFAASEGF